MGQFDGHRKRLRDRFLEHGLDALPDHQVLELLLFHAISRKDTNPLARQLLDRFGTLSAVFDASMEDLMSVDGIGENTALLLYLITPMARRYMTSRMETGVILSNTKAIGEYLVPFFFGATEEMVYLLCMDAKCKVLCCKHLLTGSVNSANFSFRKAAEVAISCNASTVVLAHNHTSGVATPSKADYDTTFLLREAFEALDIIVTDHIIVADNDFISMSDSGFFR